MLLPVNLLAVLVAALAAMVIGFLWYGPLFGRAWMRMRKKDPAAFASMKMPYDKLVLQFVASLVTAYFLAQFMGWVLILGFTGALVLGFWIWLAFYATTMLDGVLWEEESWELYAFNVGERLLMLLVMVAILAAWR